MIRTTTNIIQERWINDIQQRLQNLDTLNRQIGSGKRIEKPSDDPTGANRVIKIDEIIAKNEQYLRNIDIAVSYNSTTETVLDQIENSLSRVKSLTVEGSNEASLPKFGTLQAFAEEVNGIYAAVKDLALTKLEGRYLFNGTSGDSAPYAETGNDYLGDANTLKINLGNEQTVPLNLTGDRAFRETDVRSDVALFDNGATVNVAPPLSFVLSDGQGVDATINLSGVYTGAGMVSAINAQLGAVNSNIEAREVDGKLGFKFRNEAVGGEMKFTTVSGDLEGTLHITQGAKNIFGLLSDLENTMRTKNLAEVSNFLGRIDRVADNVINQRGQYGARAKNLLFAKDRITEHNLTNKTLKENIEGADIAETVTRYSSQEQAYQTALAAAARIFNVSILNYLR